MPLPTLDFDTVIDSYFLVIGKIGDVVVIGGGGHDGGGGDCVVVVVWWWLW